MYARAYVHHVRVYLSDTYAYMLILPLVVKTER